jgi:hypothetical protein
MLGRFYFGFEQFQLVLGQVPTASLHNFSMIGEEERA